ncbi:hypothetical protein J132_04765 [Termitomyces sp. J132]|nr:hypothetical protein J132_04765 [Termitomyces sp. J132]
MLIERGPANDKPGASRFSKRITSEVSRTIWKIRCKWRILREAEPEKRHHETEIKNKLRQAIMQRIKLDCLAMDRSCFGRKATDMEKVQNTWKFFLPCRADPVKAWRRATEVLVGIG